MKVITQNSKVPLLSNFIWSVESFFIIYVHTNDVSRWTMIFMDTLTEETGIIAIPAIIIFRFGPFRLLWLILGCLKPALGKKRSKTLHGFRKLLMKSGTILS